ncbi:MAG: hypothetical protein P8Y67_08400, partial [Alphaproteobacteria bacterium]
EPMEGPSPFKVLQRRNGGFARGPFRGWSKIAPECVENARHLLALFSCSEAIMLQRSLVC